MKTLSYSLMIAAAFSVLLSPAVRSGLKYEEQVFDFGHVAIDFNVFHTFTYVNQTDKVVAIVEIDVNCDCSTVASADTLVEPGDTAFFRLTFSTRDYYGPTNKSFRVVTDDPGNPELKYFYLSTIGQWFSWLKPEPPSAFFLPGKKAVSIKVPNKSFKEIKVARLITSDLTFTVDVKEDKAQEGGSLELEIAPADNLQSGTFLASLTVVLEVSGQEKPTILTIPIKIVRY